MALLLILGAFLAPSQATQDVGEDKWVPVHNNSAFKVGGMVRFNDSAGDKKKYYNPQDSTKGLKIINIHENIVTLQKTGREAIFDQRQLVCEKKELISVSKKWYNLKTKKTISKDPNPYKLNAEKNQQHNCAVNTCPETLPKYVPLSGSQQVTGYACNECHMKFCKDHIALEMINGTSKNVCKWCILTIDNPRKIANYKGRCGCGCETALEDRKRAWGYKCKKCTFKFCKNCTPMIKWTYNKCEGCLTREERQQIKKNKDGKCANVTKACQESLPARTTLGCSWKKKPGYCCKVCDFRFCKKCCKPKRRSQTCKPCRTKKYNKKLEEVKKSRRRLIDRLSCPRV